MSYIDTTGTIDSTAGLADLVAGGGDVQIPAGTIKISAPIPITQPGWYRGKKSATTILMADPTADAFQVTGNYAVLGNLSFASTVTRTGGAYLNVLPGTHFFVFENYHMNGAFIGIKISPGDGTPAQLSSDLQFLNGRMLGIVPNVGEGVQIHQGLAVKFDGLLMNGTAQCASNFHVLGCGDVELAHANLMTGGNCLWLDSQGEDGGIFSFWAHDSFFDSSTYGVLVHASNGGKIIRSRMANCWMGGSSQTGIFFAADGTGYIDGFGLSMPHVFGSGNNGVTIRDAGCKNIHFIDPQISGNGVNVASSGLVIGDGVTGLQVHGGLIGAGNGFGGQSDGLWFMGSVNKSAFRDVDLSGNGSRYNAVPSGTGNVFAPLP